jgi:peptidylprolyl isomerase
MAEAKSGDRVKVHYTGTLGDGTEFDSSRGSEPIEITLGEHEVIPGFEDALVGMSEGDTKKVELTCEQAYGSYREKHVGMVERSQLPGEADVQVGMVLEAQAPDGTMTKVMVKQITDEAVIIDGNHPLAGKALTFDLELVEILTLHN